MRLAVQMNLAHAQIVLGALFSAFYWVQYGKVFGEMSIYSLLFKMFEIVGN